MSLFSPSQEVFFSPFLLKQLKLEESVNEEKEIDAKKSKKFEGDWKLTNKCQSRERWQFANQLRKLIQL